MLLSFALIFLTALLLGGLASKLQLPALIGMLIAGILLGPYGLNLIDSVILDISPVLRQIALIIILTRAGLGLHLEDLRKVGRPAFLLSFLPACLEIAAMIVLAPRLFAVSQLEAALLGSVIAAVSPAVIVPRMLLMIENNEGTKKSIPQMIMAGASIDDIFVIVLFYTFLSMFQGETISAVSLLEIPFSILSGILLGGISGLILLWLFRNFHIRDTIKVLLFLSVSFLLVSAEELLSPWFPVSGLLGVMAAGIALLTSAPALGRRLSIKFNKLWVGAEVILFVLVGAAVDLQYAGSAGFKAVLLLVLTLLVRMAGVWICLLKTRLSSGERIFCMIAYIPKATVQAAIGGIPLALGLSCGNLILTIAVLSILITAPAGAIGIDRLKKKLLN